MRCLLGRSPARAMTRKGGGHGRFHPASRGGVRDRRNLRAGRDRLHAALADFADDQLRARRVRHAARVLHPDCDEDWRPVLGRGRDRHPGVGDRARRAVQAPAGRSDDPPRRVAARDRHHGARAVSQRSREGLLQRRGTAVPAARGRHQCLVPRRHRRAAEPDRAGDCARRGHRAAALSQSHADRPPHAGDRAEPDGRAHPRHPGRRG